MAKKKEQWLARQVAEQMQERLLNPIRPGGRLAPVRQLAAEFGVCVRTVLAAQKLLAQQGKLQIRHGSGVYVSKSAPAQWIGIYTAFNILQPRTSAFHTLALNALRQYFTDRGYLAEIYIGQSAPGEMEQQPSNQRFVEDVAAGRFAGLVIQSAPETAGWAQWAEGLRVPAVGRHTPYDVQAGYDEMVSRSVRHLVGQGCRRIAMLSFAPGAGEVALKSALTGCGLDYRAEWVRHDLHPMLSGAGWEEFREIWLARREKPDGLVVMDDVLFDEARIAIQELGLRVPEQLRIVTHANKGAVRRYPFPVTEFQMDPERYAETMGGMLLKRLRGEPMEASTVMVPFEMVEAAPVAEPAVATRVVPHEAGMGQGT